MLPPEVDSTKGACIGFCLEKDQLVSLLFRYHIGLSIYARQLGGCYKLNWQRGGNSLFNTRFGI